MSVEYSTSQQVVIVRHGATEWSGVGRHTGRTDLPLTDDGRVQAKKLRRVLGSQEFAAVFASPSQRALDTARLAGFGSELIVDADLLEWDYGDYEGRTSAEVRVVRPGWTLWSDGCPGGETLEQVARRADRVIERIRKVEGDVLAFAHGHLLRILTARWLEMQAVEAQRFVLLPASPSTLGYEHEWAALRTWNLPLG